jgi:hypothetical protein
MFCNRFCNRFESQPVTNSQAETIGMPRFFFTVTDVTDVTAFYARGLYIFTDIDQCFYAGIGKNNIYNSLMFLRSVTSVTRPL